MMTILLQCITILNTMLFEGFVVVGLHVGYMNAGLILSLTVFWAAKSVA